MALRLKMVKRTRESESESDGTTTTTMTTTAYDTVFIDTSLDTHLAMIVSDADTVADFKKKINSEHLQCFPKIGEIKIHALKVKRKACFYHLSDSMLVKSAFEGAKKNWFLSVDASSLKEQKEKLHSWKPDAGNQLALLCITNYPSGDGNNLLPGSPSNRLSTFDESLLPQPGNIQHANMKVPHVDQSGLVNPCKEVSKDLEMEVKHITDDYCKNLSSATNRSDLDLQEKYNQLSEENKVPGTNVKGKVDRSRDGIADVQCNNSGERSLRTVCAAKKKRKKNNGDVVCDHALEDKQASFHVSSKDTLQPEIAGPEKSSGNAGGEILNDMMVGNIDVSKEPCKTFTNKRSDSGTRRRYDVREGTKVPGTHIGYKNEKSKNRIYDVQCNNSLEEASQSGPTARKKHKIESKEGTGTLVFNSDKESSKPETIICEKSIEVKQKGRNATSDSLSTEPLDNVLLINSSISEKRKKKGKKKSSASHDHLVSALHDAGEENFKEDEEIKPKVSGGVSYAAAIPEESIQHATLSKHLGISQKEKHSEPVQEVVEGNKVPCSSIGINMIEPDAGTQGKEDASELAAGFGLKRRKNSKKHNANDVKGVPSLPVRELDNLKKDVAQSEHENIVPDYHNFETIQTEKIEEEKELSRNHDSEVILSKKCKPLNLSEADMNVRKTINSAKLSVANIIMESGSSTAKIRKKKRSKKFVAGEQFTSDTEWAYSSLSGISSPVPFSTLNDHSSSEAKKEESKLSWAEKAKVSEVNEVDPSFMVADGEGDSVTGNEAKSLMPTQICKSEENAGNMDEKSKKKLKKNRSSAAMTLPDLPIKEQGNEVEMKSMQLSKSNKIPENAENVDEKLRKKTKKNQNFTFKSFPDLPIKEQEVGGEELASSNDRMREVDPKSKTTKKTRSVKTSALNQLTGSELELKKNIGTECGSFHPQHNSSTVPSSQVPSLQSLESNSKGRLPEANVVTDALKNGCMDDANNHLEDSECEGDRVNYRDYFVVAGHQNEVAPAEVLVDKVNGAKRSDRKLKNIMKKPVPAVGTSPNRKSHSRNSSGIQLQESLPKVEHNEAMLHYNKKSSKISQKGGKALHSQDTDQIKLISQEARRLDIFSGSGTSIPAPAYPKKNSESLASFISGSESSDKAVQKRRDNGDQSSLSHRVTVAKVSSKNNEEVVTSSKHGKSLLATPSAIFRDGSSESSDENGAINSDSSTRTPSDDSSLSGYSEGERKSSLESPRNGFYGTKGREGGGKNMKKSISPGPKNISISMILRGSSKFKAAKLSASQFNNTVSQPVDYVPDSPADL